MFSKILKTKKEFIIINGFTLRLDAPFDKRNVLPWHVDAWYFEQTHPDYNAGVCWMPLTNISFENGTARFIPGSNKSKVNPKNLKFTRKSKLAASVIEIPISEEEKKLITDDIGFVKNFIESCAYLTDFLSLDFVEDWGNIS